MIQAQINAKVPGKDGKPEVSATITVNFPDVDKDPKAAMAEAIKEYGEKAILSNAFANWRVTLQSNMRAGLTKGENQAQIQARLGNAKMGVAAVGAKVDTEAAFKAKFLGATPQERIKMLEELKALAGQK